MPYFPYFYIDPYYLLLVVPALILSVIAQIQVKTTFRRYQSVPSRSGLTAAQACRLILDRNNLQNIGVETVAGELTDHYDPRARVIRLSASVAPSTSVAAIGVAAHEAGHAVQYQQNYFPIRVRAAIIPITQIGTSIAPLLLIAGLLFSYQPLVSVGLLGFFLMVVFQLVTLPVEFNASRRALAALSEGGLMEPTEIAQTRKVLSAAAMTYVAALLVSLANFLRLFLLFGGRRRND